MKNYIYLPLILLITFIVISPYSYSAKCISGGRLVDCETVFGRDMRPKLAEESWGESGRVAYQAAARIMKKRSPNGVWLDKKLRDALRPYFGSTVDKTIFHWGTPGLDEWAANTYGISPTGSESAAQTYGYHVYVRQQRPQNYSNELVSLLIHELTHVKQYERYSKSLSNFGYHYFKQYKKANQNYFNNKLEREAQENENKYLSSVLRNLSKSQSKTFVKHGNNGTTSCNNFCSSPRWGFDVGTCSSAKDTNSGKNISCNGIRGHLKPEVTCYCNKNAKVRAGNNGTTNCINFCRRTGESCLSAFNQKSGRTVSCETTPGYIDGKHLLCSCM